MAAMTSFDPTRRDVLRASFAFAAAGTGGLLVGTARADAEQAKRSFSARNAMRFFNMPDTGPLGLPRVPVVYAGQMWPKQASKADPDIDFLIRKTIPALRRKVANPDLVIIDIEHWHLADPPPDEIERNMSRYIAVVDTFRRHLPGTRFGFYGMIPVRNYWAPVKRQASVLARWHNENQRLQRLADSVDIIFPSLYAFEDDPAAWTAYAIANIEQAKQYGKPVHAFLWPQFHGSRQTISASFWRAQLETVYQQADGLVIWSPARGRPRWEPDAAWWLETVAFLEKTGLAG